MPRSNILQVRNIPGWEEFEDTKVVNIKNMLICGESSIEIIPDLESKYMQMTSVIYLIQFIHLCLLCTFVIASTRQDWQHTSVSIIGHTWLLAGKFEYTKGIIISCKWKMIEDTITKRWVKHICVYGWPFCL